MQEATLAAISLLEWMPLARGDKLSSSLRAHLVPLQ